MGSGNYYLYNSGRFLKSPHVPEIFSPAMAGFNLSFLIKRPSYTENLGGIAA